jgi:hypothetical protein
LTQKLILGKMSFTFLTRNTCDNAPWTKRAAVRLYRQSLYFVCTGWGRLHETVPAGIYRQILKCTCLWVVVLCIAFKC